VIARSVTIADASGPAEARRVAVATAQTLGYDEADVGRVALLATELGTNVWRHAGGGEVLVKRFEDERGVGVECIALDRGPGIADLDAAMRDGHSTAGTSGTGLGALRRNADSMDVYSQPVKGTAILIRMRPGHGARPADTSDAAPDIAWLGAVQLPKPGEDVCGDAWSFVENEVGVSVMVADGLGHGGGAAEASQAAVRAFDERGSMRPVDLLGVLHAKLQPTRGAAISIAAIDEKAGVVRYAGVGNVAGAIVHAGTTKQMVSHHGTIGHAAKRMHQFDYPFQPPSLLVMCSDGIATNWSLASYPGIESAQPTLIAAIVYRDFCRGRDDVTVVVARIPRP
jgi:anti-sigma regulatory factor (Ser/Thr protein kinase)